MTVPDLRGMNFPVITGEITQVDYDERGRISVLHVAEHGGLAAQIRIWYPERESFAADGPVTTWEADHRPEVSVVRLAP